MPTITKVIVSASTCFNHPHETYANFKPGVTLEAVLSEGDDYYTLVKELQDRAETLVQSHKDAILEDLERLNAIEQARTDLEYAEQRHKNYQDNTEAVEKLRKKLDDLLGQQASQHMITQGPIIDEVGADDDELEEFTNMADSESPEVHDHDYPGPPEEIAF
jgi:hypothetical protein